MKTRTFKTLFALVLGLTFSACENGAVQPKQNKRSADDVKKVMSLRNEFDFIQNFINESLAEVTFEGNSGGRKGIGKNIGQRMKEYSPCAGMSGVAQSEESLVVTMDFGDGCQSEGGPVLAGKAVLTMNFASDVSISYQVEFINYQEIYEDEDVLATVNGESDGSFSIDLSSNLFSQKINQSLKMTYKDGSNVLFSSSQKIESTDEEIRIVEYTSEGSFSNGDTFSISIIKTLIYNLSCPGVDFPVEGIEALTFNGNETEINYGNGECDNDYTID